jgi:hypothetical protein
MFWASAVADVVIMFGTYIGHLVVAAVGLLVGLMSVDSIAMSIN